MKLKTNFNVIKATGEKEPFSYEKFRESLINSGANRQTIEEIIHKIQPFLREGLTTQELYSKTYSLIKEESSICASRYSLKEGLRLLGPSGFPFEYLVAGLYQQRGYKTTVGSIIRGRCVEHEIDVLAQKEDKYILVEVKFHNQRGTKSAVQTPLYVKARFDDIGALKGPSTIKHANIESCDIITNTKFSGQAIQYGTCIGLRMIAWNFPRSNGLEKMIEEYFLYPITILTALNASERKELLANNIVLCEQVQKNPALLTKAGIKENRRDAILKECEQLCK